MAEEIPAYVQETKQLLDALLSRNFAEKHLVRPPFGFLKDIFTGIINTTGFASDLYTPEELAADMDKNAKIAFLQKMIDHVQSKTGEAVTAKPTKIVAGLEAEQTNQFLQQLARVAAVSSSSPTAVASSSEPKKKRSSSKSKKASDDSEEKRNTKSEEGGEKKKKKKATDGEGGEKKPKKKAASANGEGEKKKKKKVEEGSAEPKKKKAAEGTEKKPKKKAASAEGADKPKKKVIKKKESEEAPPRIPEPIPQVAMHTAAPVEEPPRREEPRKEEARPQIPPAAMVRPQTAGIAPPRIQSNVRTVEKAQDNSTAVEKKTLLIEEGLEEEDDDDLADLGLDDDEEDNNTQEDKVTEPSSEDAEAHGGLVRNIIEASKGSETPKKEKERVKVDTLATNHHREVLQKEINKLRDSIQSLCKSANPLGKTMDYVQEDFENMAKELQKWQQESQQQVAKLEEEQRVTEQTLQPGVENLNELEIKIRGILIQINSAKAVIVKNDETIHKMLSMVVNH